MRTSYIYALSNVGFLPLDEWQRAIERLDLLASVKLLVVKAGLGQVCTARIGEKPTQFACEETRPEILLADQHPNLLGIWSHALGFGDFGKSIEATAAAVACISFAIATGGAVKRVGTEPTSNLGEARHELDARLASNLQLEDAYFARYPDERPTEPAGPMELGITLHRGRS